MCKSLVHRLGTPIVCRCNLKGSTSVLTSGIPRVRPSTWSCNAVRVSATSRSRRIALQIASPAGAAAGTLRCTTGRTGLTSAWTREFWLVLMNIWKTQEHYKINKQRYSQVFLPITPHCSLAGNAKSRSLWKYIPTYGYSEKTISWRLNHSKKASENEICE